MSWNDDMAYAMTLYKFLTLPLGVWPLQKYNTFSLVRSIVCGFSLSVMLITMLLEINFGNGDAYVKIDTLMVISCIILATLKLLSFRLYADNLIRNYSSAVNDYSTIDTEEKPGNKDIQVDDVSKTQASKLPMPLTFLEDLHIPSSLYFVISTLQYTILMITCTTNCASSIFTLAPMMTGDEDIHINVSIKNQAAKLPVPITFLGDLQIPTGLYFVISTVQYFILLLTGTSNCGFRFILALKSHDAVMITKTITVMSTLLLQLFFYSFVGDYMKCQMEQIAHSIYISNWYYLPNKLMRNVLLVIMRSQQPVQLLAGRFFVVNIKTYMIILKSSLSYLSVLRVMMET
ncbi:PREDICTED: odorant receptor 82a-like [Acromyrmex echinatior]|uniref:odorant receptor 82a-like n=1 Tax=Acromyrmex echinatior TaxID=103372 RepID=UPI000581068E|nr:PREDICTED: odorant receptor 82a-like [Acromyrmex echinatior]